MKKVLIVLSFISLAFTTTGDPVDRLGIKSPLEFHKTAFNLAWSEKPNDNYYVQEYLPKNETLEKFNQMLTIHLFNLDVSVDNAIAQKVEELTQRKKSDQVCNFSVSKSPDGKEQMLDCILSVGKNEKLEVAEFIIYKYKQIELKGKGKCLVIYSYSKRAYGDEILPFLKKLGNERSDLLNEMIVSNLPDIRIK